MKKKLTILLAVLAMILLMVPTAFAEEAASGTCGENLTWTLSSDGTLTISGEGEMLTLENKYSPWRDYANEITRIEFIGEITSICGHAFNCFEKLEEITIPDSVTRIGDYAFQGCSNLQKVTIPESVTSIGSLAFSWTPWLNNQEGFVIVGDHVLLGYFGQGEPLEDLVVPCDVKYIADFAFGYNGTGGFNGNIYLLNSVILPEGLIAIGACAFETMHMTEIVFPSTLEKIGEWAFDYTALEKVYFTGNAPECCENAFTDNSGWRSETVEPWLSVYYLNGATGFDTLFGDDQYSTQVWNDAPEDLSQFFSPHNYVLKDYVSATCTLNGYTGNKICQDCGKTIVGEETEKLGHTFGDWTQVAAPTTDSEGLEVRKCACGEAEQRAIAKLPADPEPALSFTDVKADSFYYDSVLWAVENGITTGRTETTFVPKDPCKRSEVVTFLHRSQGKPAPADTETGFSDVKPGKFYTDAVAWAVEEEITNGMTATEFGTDLSCTRAQVVTFLWRAAGSPQPVSTECEFTDVQPGGFYYDAVLWAVENGITNGLSETTFGVKDTCTRAQIVTFLHRFAG